MDILQCEPLVELLIANVMDNLIGFVTKNTDTFTGAINHFDAISSLSQWGLKQYLKIDQL